MSSHHACVCVRGKISQGGVDPFFHTRMKKMLSSWPGDPLGLIMWKERLSGEPATLSYRARMYMVAWSSSESRLRTAACLQAASWATAAGMTPAPIVTDCITPNTSLSASTSCRLIAKPTCIAAHKREQR